MQQTFMAHVIIFSIWQASAWSSCVWKKDQYFILADFCFTFDFKIKTTLIVSGWIQPGMVWLVSWCNVIVLHGIPCLSVWMVSPDGSLNIQSMVSDLQRISVVEVMSGSWYHWSQPVSEIVWRRSAGDVAFRLVLLERDVVLFDPLKPFGRSVTHF